MIVEINGAKLNVEVTGNSSTGNFSTSSPCSSSKASGEDNDYLRQGHCSQERHCGQANLPYRLR